MMSLLVLIMCSDTLSRFFPHTILRSLFALCFNNIQLKEWLMFSYTNIDYIGILIGFQLGRHNTWAESFQTKCPAKENNLND